MSHQRRTKGNVKPSNSDRTARLMSENAFVSFSEASQTLSSVYVDKEANKDETSSSTSFGFDLSSDFQVVFKHMTKKDANTKMKALQDFASLCCDKDEQELVKVGKSWFRIYRKMANMIDWRIRQEVHQTLLKFVSTLSKDKILELFASNDAMSSGEPSSNAFSFNKTVTMPAVLWTASYDPYGQAAEAALKVLLHIFPTPQEKISFLLNNFETILEYCLCNVFDSIPIKLFYTAQLPPDSVCAFNDHMCITSMRGLASMINELVCFYLQAEAIDAQLQARALSVLQAIFLHINNRFCAPETTTQTMAVDASANNESGGKKDKKNKLKKIKGEESNNESTAGKEHVNKAASRFWNFDASSNATVRVAMTHALNSFTRLTSLLLEVNEEEHIFDGSFHKSQAWYLEHKAPFYELVFNRLFDSVLEVKGLSWLLASHLLLNDKLYQPWATLDVDRFLQSLACFVTKGMRTEGATLDFGLFSLHLERHMLLYPEYFAQKTFYLSGAQLVLENHADAEQAANGKLMIVFVQAFHRQQKFRIFATLLSSLNEGLRETRLRRDIEFMLELYYNLVYYYMLNCYKLAVRHEPTSKNEADNHKVVRAVEKLTEDIFLQDLLEMITFSLKDESKSYHATPIYLNLLLLAYHTNELYHHFSSGASMAEYDPALLLALYEQFKGRIAELYHHMFKQAHHELTSNLEGKSVLHIDRMLKFLNEAIYFREDGYFSSEYYYTPNSMGYDRVAFKIAMSLKKPGNQEEKRVVRFGDTENAEDKDDEQLNWWMHYQKQSVFYFSLANPATSGQRSKFNSDYCISLYNELPSIQEAMDEIMLDLWRLFDRRLITFKSDASHQPKTDRRHELFTIVIHLQYLLRGFSSHTLVRLCPMLTKTVGAKLVSDYSECLRTIIRDFILRWIETCATFCDMIDDGPRAGGEEARQELSFQVILCRKIYDVLLVLLVKIYDDCPNNWQRPLDEALDVLVNGLRPYSYCALVHHLSRLSTKPITARYATVNIRCKERLLHFSDRLEKFLYDQIDLLFTSSTAINLNCNIFIDLLSFALNQSNLCYAKQFTLCFQLRVANEALQRLYRYLEPKPSINRLDYQLFPSLCEQIYKILFQFSSQLSQLPSFETTLTDYVRLFFKQTFHKLLDETKLESEDDKKEEGFHSSLAFYKLAFNQLFQVLPLFDANLKQLVLELLQFVRLSIFSSATFNNYLSIQQFVLDFTCLLVQDFKVTIIDNRLYDNSDPVLVETRQFLNNFGTQLELSFAEKVTEFVDQVELSVALWQLTNPANKWSAGFDLFLGPDSHKLSTKLAKEANDIMPNDCLHKMVALSNCVATFVEAIIPKIFLDSTFEEYFDDAITFKLLRASQNDFQQSNVFGLVRSLMQTSYYLDRYFQIHITEDLQTAFQEFRGKLNSIVVLILKRLQTISSQTRFAAFIVGETKLAYGHYCLETFLPRLNWADVVKSLVASRSMQLVDAGKLTSIDCLSFFYNHQDVAGLREHVRRTLDRYSPSTASSRLPSFDWPNLTTKEAYSLLIFGQIVFAKLDQSAEEASSYEEIERFRVALLSLPKHLEMIELVDEIEPCGLLALYNNLIEIAFPGPHWTRHYRALFQHQSISISMLYSSMPTDGDTGLPFKLLALIILSSYDRFANQTLTWLDQKKQAKQDEENSKDDSNKEENHDCKILDDVQQLWRNFLALHSYNVLLPIFVTLSEIVAHEKRRKNELDIWMEQSLAEETIKVVSHLDSEALTDIATLQANQVLLGPPKSHKSHHKSCSLARVEHLKSILSKYEQSMQSTTSSSPQKEAVKPMSKAISSKMKPLVACNDYYDYVLTHGFELLLHPQPAWALSSFQVLSVLMQCQPWQRTIAKANDQGNDSDDIVHRDQFKEETSIAPPEVLLELLTHLESLTHGYIFEGHTFGQVVKIAPGGDTFGYVQAYLLAWLLYFDLVKAFPVADESRAELIHFLLESGMHQRLLLTLFNLLPDEEIDGASEMMQHLVNKLNQCSSSHSSLVTIVNEGGESHRLERLAVAVYYGLLETCPIVVRLWFTALKPSQKPIVEHTTERYFSPVLINKEIDNFDGLESDPHKCKQLGNILVKIFKRRKEIVATYSLNEICFEMKFEFKANYPLTAIGLECTNRSGVNEDTTRRWMHRLNRFFNKQNCSIYEGLILIRSNMDNFFQNIEECIICLFVLYGSTGQLPKFRCPQCRKRFHWSCIRKWFQQNTSCPQCKYAFD